MLNQQDSAALDVTDYMQQLGQRARDASHRIARATTAQKNDALLAVARTIDSQRNELMAANALDLQAGREKNLEAPLLDRLELTPARIDAMIEGLRQVAGLDDPVGFEGDITQKAGILALKPGKTFNAAYTITCK